MLPYLLLLGALLSRLMYRFHGRLCRIAHGTVTWSNAVTSWISMRSSVVEVDSSFFLEWQTTVFIPWTFHFMFGLMIDSFTHKTKVSKTVPRSREHIENIHLISTVRLKVTAIHDFRLTTEI